MRSGVSQIGQPHDVAVEVNKNGGQNEFENERQLYVRAQKLGIVAKELVEITGYYVDGGEGKAAPYTLIGQPVDVGEFPDETSEKGTHQYVRAYVSFDKTEHKEVEKGKVFRRTHYSYSPDFEKVNKVGVIYLAGATSAAELRHVGSAHWAPSESTSPEEVLTIEKGIKAIQDVIGNLTLAQNDIAS